MGPLHLAIIVDELPDDLLAEIDRRWPVGANTRRKVSAFIRHCYSNYDAVCYSLAGHRYDELQNAARDKIGAALDEWLERHPRITIT